MAGGLFAVAIAVGAPFAMQVIGGVQARPRDPHAADTGRRGSRSPSWSRRGRSRCSRCAATATCCSRTGWRCWWRSSHARCWSPSTARAARRSRRWRSRSCSRRRTASRLRARGPSCGRGRSTCRASLLATGRQRSRTASWCRCRCVPATLLALAVYVALAYALSAIPAEIEVAIRRPAAPDMSVDVSVCVAVYRAHGAPNVAIARRRACAARSAGCAGELVVALNGIAAVGRRRAGRGADVAAARDNLGVAPGWNAAARAATRRRAGFANDDVVLGPGVARAAGARRCASARTPGVVGPVGVDAGTGEHVATRRLRRPGRQGVEECDAVSGFLFATRRATWEAVGGFDEAYAPASWEEIDFNCAVQRLGAALVRRRRRRRRRTSGASRRRQPPWRTVRWGGRRELLWSIHRRNRRHFLRQVGRSSVKPTRRSPRSAPGPHERAAAARGAVVPALRRAARLRPAPAHRGRWTRRARRRGRRSRSCASCSSATRRSLWLDSDL